MALNPGLTAEVSAVVQKENMASAMGSGGVEVFSTPSLVALMEGAAFQAVQPHLNPGETTVGTLVNVKHLAATPGGMTVRAVARLEQVDGRRLVFAVEAFDDREKVGEGTHERVVVAQERFLARVHQKGLS